MNEGLYRYTAFTLHDGVLLLQGLGWTLAVFAVSMVCGALIGALGGLIRHARLRGLSPLVGLYVEIFRNSPVLVQLFLVFYGLPVVAQVRLSPLTAAVLTLSVNTGAFMTVIVRAALEAVPGGQLQAGMALGLRYGQLMRLIVLPQAIRLIIPATISLAVGQLQVTSLVSLINVVDLTKAGSILNLRTLRPFAVWPVVAALYFALTKPLALLGERAERRFRLRGTGSDERR
jgi:His/Glu/Gln/Arg/opine family amino acid ABC transporter permease subunit